MKTNSDATPPRQINCLLHVKRPSIELRAPRTASDACRFLQEPLLRAISEFDGLDYDRQVLALLHL